MSDNVRYLGDNGTGGVGYSGANGFPFDYAAGPTGSNPIIVTFQDCIKWWWRVKNWSLTTDASITDRAGNTYSIPNGTMVPGPANAISELGLINYIGHSFTDSGSAAPNAGAQFSVGGGGILKIGSDLYPSISAGGIATSPEVVISPDVAEILAIDSTQTAYSTSITGMIDGYPFPVYYDATTFPPNAFTFSTYILTPVEFWPHAQLIDGLAVYNTATGAVIPGRSPLA